jgi:prefoldin subunit 5
MRGFDDSMAFRNKVPNASTTENGTAEASSNQALQAVDVAVGASARVADVVTKAIEPLRKPDTREKELKTRREQLEQVVREAQTRGTKIRRQVTQEVTERTKPARDRAQTELKRVRSAA